MEQLPSGLEAPGFILRGGEREPRLWDQKLTSLIPLDRIPPAAAQITDGKTRVGLGGQEEDAVHVQARQRGRGPAQCLVRHRCFLLSFFFS